MASQPIMPTETSSTALTIVSQADVERRDNNLLEAAKSIIGRLDSQAREQVTAKLDIEERWLRNLRHYYGKYDADALKEMNLAKRSTAFVKTTRYKTDSWAARLSDLLMPTDGKNWGAEPTPVPKLSKVAQAAVKKAQQLVEQANQASDQAASSPDPSQQQALIQQAHDTAQKASAFAEQAAFNEASVEEAQKRCKAMEDAIEDQLVQSDYQARCREVLEDGCRLGTGILKGPLTANRARSEWRPGMAGTAANDVWQLTQTPDPMPEYVNVDPWHFFPDMSAKHILEAEFTYERSLPTKKDLRKYARDFGFNKAAVRRLLNEGPGEAPEQNLNWLTTLRAMTDGAAPIKGRYVMWEYHGPLESDEVVTLLRAAGEHDAADLYEKANDPLEEPRVIIHFCRGEVLKISPEYPLDSGDPLYSVWNFAKGETSIFGIGIPEIMHDSQHALNSAWRMMMDNAALSVGPQIVINKGMAIPQDGSYDLRPLKIWLLSSTAHQNINAPVFQAINIPNNQQQLAGIIELAKAFADEETSMPMIAQGEQGAASKTLGGMSILFNSANVVFRRVVKSFDDELTKPTIRRAYDWNMQFNPDPSIKGDMQVKALGTSVLLVRETQSQNLLNIAQNWSTHPVLGGYIKVREVAEKTLETMMIPPSQVLYTQDEADKRLKETAAAQAQAQAAAAPPPAAPPPKDDTAVRVAEIRAQSQKDSDDVKMKIAQAQIDMDMATLQETTGLSRQELEAKYGITQILVGSKERTEAARVAVENQRTQAMGGADAGAPPASAPPTAGVA